MGKITFILGGARSGKSQFALKLASSKKKTVAFIATCQPKDKEMKKRIDLHKQARPKHWQTIEEPLELTSALNKLNPKCNLVLIDCLTLLVSNLMLKKLKQKEIENKLNQAVTIFKKIKADSIIVSNEVGLGIVPLNPLAREFRDIAGRINQNIAKEADKVYFLISGIPWRIK